MDLDDRKLFEESLIDVIDATPADDLGAALAEFGWTDLLASDAPDAIDVVGELIGSRALGEHALEAVLRHSVGSNADAVVLPSLGAALPTTVATRTGNDLRLEIDGTVVARSEAPATILVPAMLDGAAVVLTVPYDGAWPTVGTGVSPEAGLATLTVSVTIASDTAVVDDAAWPVLRSAAFRLLARELTGAARAMLALAVDHVSSREQFGRTLASFQAVRHRLADVRHWIEVADLAVAAAHEDADEDSSRLAKTLANRASASARENCQQVLGGMGFTWEYDFHWLAKRALLLEPLFGSTASLRAETGGGVIAEPGLTTRLVRL